MRTIVKYPSCFNIPISAAEGDSDFIQHYFERKQNAQAKKRAALDASIQKVKDSGNNIEVAFEEFVPPSGPAKSFGGECVRAMMRLMYRDYNDGDVFYEGYGIETCADSVAFLWDSLPDSVVGKFEFMAADRVTGNEYTQSLEQVAEKLMDYLMEDPEENFSPYKDPSDAADSRNYNGQEFIKDMDWMPTYEYSCEIPNSLQAHVDAGHIDYSDIEEELGSWDFAYRGDYRISVNRWEGVTIDGLDSETYDELRGQSYGRDMYDLLEDWGYDLNDEYGDPSEEDEDEDEEYEE